ncbi:glycosyl hydrolase family 76-domain-containing protein [Terfezia claveryi]|nr:glycosyl hydrolase family 76-domain-containing protein [Terfezia claveryi]
MVLSPNGGVHRLLSSLLLLLVLVGRIAQAQIPLNLDNQESIKSAAKVAAAGMMRDYIGNQPGQIPGRFVEPYYWWECGAAWGAMIDYWYYTGDTTWNKDVTEGLLWQVGPAANYMPPNVSKSLGNDDQCFWGLAVMAAAEKNYPDPPADQPQWLALAQGVFNSQTRRWDTKTCNGGLRWQIFTFNNGFNYKNSISNGCFFQLAARLARYTGNDTYAQWAERAYDWTVESGLLSPRYEVYDGIATDNCTNMDIIQWTYNAGTYIAGAAFLYNITNSAIWKNRLDSLITAAGVMFANPEWDQGEKDVMIEPACEFNTQPPGFCDPDQRSFKAYLARFMILAVKMAPYTESIIMPYLRTTAVAAAKNCRGGADGTTCSLRWSKDDWQVMYTGMGEQMAVLEVIQSNLQSLVGIPVTADKGGTSKGDPNAGLSDERTVQPLDLSPIETKDRVGAGFITAIVVSGVLGGAWWMLI